jgi:hypothetical protein
MATLFHMPMLIVDVVYSLEHGYIIKEKDLKNMRE